MLIASAPDSAAAAARRRRRLATESAASSVTLNLEFGSEAEAAAAEGIAAAQLGSAGEMSAFLATSPALQVRPPATSRDLPPSPTFSDLSLTVPDLLRLPRHVARAPVGRRAGHGPLSS